MILADTKIPKIPKNYNCVICMLNTSNKKDYERHLATQKHKNAVIMINADDFTPNADDFTPNADDFTPNTIYLI
jgi:hypothetical protein